MKSDERKQHDVWAARLRDPHWFVPRLFIQTKDGQLRTMGPIFGEQEACVDAFVAHNNILVEKPRQIGSTTVWVGLFFWMMMTCGSSYDVLAIMHEYASVTRFTRQVRRHIEMLPRAFRPRIILENNKEVRIKVGRSESSFCTTMAGGRGQGRGSTYRGVLFSEVGRYPRGSSAQGGTSGIDEDVYGSITSTMPTPEVDPLTRVVLESTPGPPSGLFYNLIKRVQDPSAASSWGFLFFPWFKFPQYRKEWPAGEEMTAEERVLLERFASKGMTRENLAFRRYLIVGKGYSERLFRMEYPGSWDEPFLLVASMWFNLEKVAAARAKTPEKGQASSGFRRYHPFNKNHTYFGSLDAAGGTGGDDACAVITRDDGVICAVWSRNDVPPREQAEAVVKLSVEYGLCTVLVEVGNVWGRAAWRRCRELAIPLWIDQEGRDFITDPRTKAAIMDWMKYLLESGMGSVTDNVILAQCEHMREQVNGNIAADVGYKDDHVLACALAWWAGRTSLLAHWQRGQESGKVGAAQGFSLNDAGADALRRMAKGERKW